MKGGRTAPRNHTTLSPHSHCQQGFNEGGADCPPKQYDDWGATSCGTSFNEGGADCPPKLGVFGELLNLLGCFNEGGADCPPKLAFL